MREITSKSKKMLDNERKYYMSIEELLYELYVQQALSLDEMSIRLNVNRKYIPDWLDKCGIYSRKLEGSVENDT